jgi:hypothetical protein
MRANVLCWLEPEEIELIWGRDVVKRSSSRDPFDLGASASSVPHFHRPRLL